MGTVGLAAQRLATHRIGAHAEHVEQVLLADRRPLLDAPAVVERSKAGTEKYARRGARLGVVRAQAGGLVAPTVPGGNRLQQVAIARPQSHLAQRDHLSSLSQGRPSSLGQAGE